MAAKVADPNIPSSLVAHVPVVQAPTETEPRNFPPSLKGKGLGIRAPSATVIPTPRRRSGLALHAAVIGFFTLLTVITTWPLAPSMWWSSIDLFDSLFSIWGLAWQAHALATNPLGLFDTNVMYPFRGTLAYDELSFGAALLSAPFYWIGGNPVLSHNIVLFLTFVLSGYGAWLLLRELGVNGWAALVAGAAYAFSFFRFNHLAHITLLSAEWLPFILLLLHRMWRRADERIAWREALALVLLFAVQCLSGHYLAFYTAATVGLFAVFYPLASRSINRRFFLALVPALTVSAALMAPVLIGYAEIQGGQGFERPLWDNQRYSATLETFLAVNAGNPIYRALLAPFSDPSPWPWERSGFPGLVPFGLTLIAVVAAFVGWRKKRLAADQSASKVRITGTRTHVAFYGLLTLLAVVLALGPDLMPTFDSAPLFALPYRFLFDQVGLVRTMRVTARALLLFSLGLSVLSGFGAAWLLRHWRPATLSLGRPAAALGLVGLLLIESWSAPLTLTPIPAGPDIPPVYRWLEQQPSQVLVEYPMVHLQRGPRNVAMANTYQYYSSYNWLPTINGSLTLRPTAYTALTQETESCFPCPRSLDALWALGASLVVVHLENLSGPQQEEFLWRQGAGLDAGLNPGEFTLTEDFGENRVYNIGPRKLAELKTKLTAGSSIVLGSRDADPIRTGAYLAAVGYWLRDYRVYGDTDLSFGQEILPRQAGMNYDYTVLYAGEDPGLYGFSAAQELWRNEHIVLYGR